MLITVEEGPVDRRKLIVRDSVNVLALLAATGALFAMTFFLFRSFSAHRAEPGAAVVGPRTCCAAGGQVR